jgi:hypothetical protein
MLTTTTSSRRIVTAGDFGRPAAAPHRASPVQRTAAPPASTRQDAQHRWPAVFGTPRSAGATRHTPQVPPSGLGAQIAYVPRGATPLQIAASKQQLTENRNRRQQSTLELLDRGLRAGGTDPGLMTEFRFMCEMVAR